MGEDDIRSLLLAIQAGERARDQATGKLEGVAEGLSFRQSELFELVRRLPCATHEATMAVIASRVDKLDGAPPARTKPPTSPGMPSVNAAELDRRLENTERTVLERAGEQLDQALAAKLQAGVVAVLDQRAAEAERAAAERREATRRDLEVQQVQVAKDLAAKAEADKARWGRVQWAAGLVATLLGSGTVLSYCNTKGQMEVDRQAVVRALQQQPAPVVVKVPTPVLVPAPAPKEE